MALIRKGRVSLNCFLLGVSIFVVSYIGVLGRNFLYLWEDFWALLLLFFVIGYNVFLFLLYDVFWEEKDMYKVT